MTVLADSLLEEVVGNLLKNAVEHGYDGQDEFTISVETSTENGRTQLRIADTGPGIPEELRDSIFDRGTSETGSGFGLFFVETMVDQYGGTVRVEARAERGSARGRPEADDSEPTGAVFIVELPTA